jgi:hypothetical protein
MSKKTANIIGTKDANFTLTIDSATILAAFLVVPKQEKVPLSFVENEVTIPSLPAGDSRVRLDLAWAPSDPDATVSLGTVISGTVKAKDPKQTIDAGQTPGFEKLFGE